MKLFKFLKQEKQKSKQTIKATGSILSVAVLIISEFVSEMSRIKWK